MTEKILICTLLCVFHLTIEKLTEVNIKHPEAFPSKVTDNGQRHEQIIQGKKCNSKNKNQTSLETITIQTKKRLNIILYQLAN